MAKVMRYLIADYLYVSSAYHLMGTGITKLDESPGPKTNTDAYVNSRVGQTELTGYENSFPVDSQFITDQTAIAALYAVARDQLTGDDAKFDYVRVDLYDRVGSTGTVYKARKFSTTFVPGDITGASTEMMLFTGSLNQNGDLVQGTFDTTSKVFTATTDPTTYAVTMTVVPVGAEVIIRDEDGNTIQGVSVAELTGVVTIPNLPTGTYEYIVFADGYVTQADTFAVETSTKALGTITLVEPA